MFQSPPHTLLWRPLFPTSRSRVLWIPGKAKSGSREGLEEPETLGEVNWNSNEPFQAAQLRQVEVLGIKTTTGAIYTNYKHLILRNHREKLNLLGGFLFFSPLSLSRFAVVFFGRSGFVCCYYGGRCSWMPLCVCVCARVYKSVRVFSRVTGLCCHQPLFW